jgi:hypothetical protein
VDDRDLKPANIMVRPDGLRAENQRAPDRASSTARAATYFESA